MQLMIIFLYKLYTNKIIYKYLQNIIFLYMICNKKGIKMKLGISSCLLGENCRYNGGHCKENFITDFLSKHFELVSFCPEHEAFGTPRESIRLVKMNDKIEALTTSTKVNLTQKLEQVSFSLSCQVKDEQFCGFVLKSKSPSCGMERVKLYEENSNVNENKGMGLFAKSLKDLHPFLPMEEEGRLHDLWLKENFLMQIFSYKDFYEFMGTEDISYNDLVEFHTKYKYLIYSKSQKAYKELGNIVANKDKKEFLVVLESYKIGFLQSISQKNSIKKTYNILLHILGYFKKHLDANEKKFLLDTCEEFKEKKIPLIVVIKLFTVYIDKLDIQYLKNQKFLNPYPKDFSIRSEIKSYK